MRVFEKCLCLTCKVATKHEVFINIRNHIIYEDECLRLYECYQIIKCINYDDIAIRKEKWNPDDIVVIGEDIYGSDILDIPSQINIYPIRDEETAFSKKFEKTLPQEIYLTYEEVFLALNNKMPLLTGLGLRTLLEQIIKYFGKSDDLGGILNQFESGGFVSTKQRELLDNICYLGNDATHRADFKSRKELILYLKVLENLIHQLFVYYKLENEVSKKVVNSVRLKSFPRHFISVVREPCVKESQRKNCNFLNLGV